MRSESRIEEELGPEDKPFPFLKLPMEIRTMTYRLLVPSDLVRTFQNISALFRT